MKAMIFWVFLIRYTERGLCNTWDWSFWTLLNVRIHLMATIVISISSLNILPKFVWINEKWWKCYYNLRHSLGDFMFHFTFGGVYVALEGSLEPLAGVSCARRLFSYLMKRLYPPAGYTCFIDPVLVSQSTELSTRQT